MLLFRGHKRVGAAGVTWPGGGGDLLFWGTGLLNPHLTTSCTRRKMNQASARLFFLPTQRTIREKIEWAGRVAISFIEFLTCSGTSHMGHHSSFKRVLPCFGLLTCPESVGRQKLVPSFGCPGPIGSHAWLAWTTFPECHRCAFTCHPILTGDRDLH